MNRQLQEVEFSGIVAVRDRLLQLNNPLRLESGEPSFDTPTHGFFNKPNMVVLLF